jgi:hypothetical protein
MSFTDLKVYYGVHKTPPLFLNRNLVNTALTFSFFNTLPSTSVFLSGPQQYLMDRKF